MYQRDIWRDILPAVTHALDGRLDRLNEADLLRHSDALLATLPSVAGRPLQTTPLVLRRYHTHLQQVLCRGRQPRVTPATVEAELCDLTRAVLLTAGIGEGVSVEAAVGLALVLYKRGVAPFCALPTARPGSADRG